MILSDGSPAGNKLFVRFQVLRAAIALMMEAASTSETSANFYQTTQRNIPEDGHFSLEVSLPQDFHTTIHIHIPYTCSPQNSTHHHSTH
jgi:hypothetical protein